MKLTIPFHIVFSNIPHIQIACEEYTGIQLGIMSVPHSIIIYSPHLNWMWGIFMNNMWNNVNTRIHCYGFEYLLLCKTSILTYYYYMCVMIFVFMSCLDNALTFGKSSLKSLLCHVNCCVSHNLKNNVIFMFEVRHTLPRNGAQAKSIYRIQHT